MSTRTVQRALNDLIEAGYVKKDYRYRPNNGQTSNLYTLVVKVDDSDEGNRCSQPEESESIKRKEHKQTEVANVEVVDFLYFKKKNDAVEIAEAEVLENISDAGENENNVSKEVGQGLENKNEYIPPSTKYGFVSKKSGFTLQNIDINCKCHGEGDSFTVP